MQLEERARKNEAVILHGVHSVGLEAIAAAVGRDASTVSRWKDTELHRLAVLLAVCGLKVVPIEFRCAKPEVIEALETLARAAINQPASLVWDD